MLSPKLGPIIHIHVTYPSLRVLIIHEVAGIYILEMYISESNLFKGGAFNIINAIKILPSTCSPCVNKIRLTHGSRGCNLYLAVNFHISVICFLACSVIFGHCLVIGFVCDVGTLLFQNMKKKIVVTFIKHGCYDFIGTCNRLVFYAKCGLSYKN